MKKLFLNIIWFFTPFLLGIIVLFILPVDKKFSYQFVKGECNNIASWIYFRMFENSKSIDIAFSGASHFACGIMDEYIESELDKHAAEKKNIVNLGYCRGGRDVQYIMLKDLFKQKSPEILFIEVAEDEPKKSHPVFPYLAETPDLFGSCVFFNQRYLSSIGKGLTVRFEYLKFRLMGKPYFMPENTSDFGYLSSTHQASREELNSNVIDWKKRLSRKKTRLFRSIESNYSKHYLQKIAKLAKENNCKIVFLYLLESGSHLKTPLHSEFYLIFGEIITIPDSIINDNVNWKDAAHFNDRGAKLTSEWLVEHVLSNLK